MTRAQLLRLLQITSRIVTGQARDPAKPDAPLGREPAVLFTPAALGLLLDFAGAELDRLASDPDTVLMHWEQGLDKLRDGLVRAPTVRFGDADVPLVTQALLGELLKWCPDPPRIPYPERRGSIVRVDDGSVLELEDLLARLLTARER